MRFSAGSCPFRAVPRTRVCGAGAPPVSNLATQHANLQGFLDGSDGTRTRDLRRDRPSRAQRRPTTNPSERAHLQALFVPRLAPLRIVEPVARPTFGPRVGHGILSSETTPATPRCRAGLHARLVWNAEDLAVLRADRASGSDVRHHG